MRLAGSSQPRPFFLGETGEALFCIYHPPAPGLSCTGAVLFVHPFGEEMNRSRRLAADQARLLAASGIGVLQLDLFGCGDSFGLLRDATWQLWKENLEAGQSWLAQETGCQVSLFAVRLGALLALDYAREKAGAAGRVTMWQPVLDGRSFLTQLLRLKIAASLDGRAAGADTVPAMRAALAGGEETEIAGYRLTPALALHLDALDAVQWDLAGRRVDWIEVVSSKDHEVPPARMAAALKMRERGNAVTLHAVHAPPFWLAPEPVGCPELLQQTTAIFTEEQA